MKEKYIQIFKYLLEFSKIRSNPVRNIENSKTNYIEVLWLSDLPKNDLIDSVLNENYTNESDYWIKVSKPKEPEKPKFPLPPLKLIDWIKSETLLYKDEYPELLSQITDEVGNVLKIEDNKQLKLLFDTYCENKWFLDSKDYWNKHEEYVKELAIYEKVNYYYKKIFSIYNKSQQLGEEYELIMGIGLLNFQEIDKPLLYCRHIITAKSEAFFEYSQSDSKLIVKQGLTDSLQIETDAIIDQFEQFETNDILDAEKKSLELIKEKEVLNPFDNDVHDVLQLFSERIKPGDGSYKNSISKPKDIPNKSTIFYAPALILRKRNTKSYTAFYEKIISDIETNNICNIKSLDELVGVESGNFYGNNNGLSNLNINNQTIYFPKKYNDEQIAIVNKAKNNNKVLVQGPPGTGKSHTIANLICHLLANGNKVLVTAYTKRALEVLKDKLPDDFKNLTVNLLSGDTSSIHDLESSVNAINDELSNTNIEVLKKETEELEYKLSSIKQKISTETNELLKIKEKSYRSFTVNNKYNGTLTEIAEILENEKDFFQWYKDDYSDDNNETLLNELNEYMPLYIKYSNTDCSIFDFNIPDKNKIVKLEELLMYFELKKYFDELDTSKYTIVNSNDINELLFEFSELKKIIEDINRNSNHRKVNIVNDYLASKTNKWDLCASRTELLLDEMSKYKLEDIDKNLEIKYPENKSLKILKNDAKAFIDYLNEGNSLSGISFMLKKPFLSKEIKEKLYFLDSVFVNGSSCDTKDEFEKLLTHIHIKQTFEELSELWNCDDLTTKYFFNNYNIYKDLNFTANNLKKLIYQAKNLIESIRLNSGIQINDFSLKSIDNHLSNINYTININEYKYFSNSIDNLKFYLSQQDLHPISKDINKSIENEESLLFENLVNQINLIETNKKDYELYKENETIFENHIPQFLNDYKRGYLQQENIQNLNSAILYKHALKYINKFLSEDYEQELYQRLKSYDSELESLTAKIAANKSWYNVLENLQINRSLRQHLEAWVQAVSKIGKTGKGKRALKFRKIAQEEMEYCKTSIPCWIMPLYKVTETISPEQGIYDYVIIDEASQLGPDAIFLLYISKNIIIVGDDKQTSPEYVGVDANTMNPFIEKHLKGIPFANFYGTEYSFFDHAKRFCEGMIVLREHFRCMPEIIEFSNKLFYAPDGKGLYPLKQYSENRLEPLVNVLCPNGFIEGSGQSIRNEPEAVMIANKVAELIKDDRYKNKTFGVICLQGNSQSTLIENLILKNIGEKEFKERKFLCGNSSSFQGDERDIIILSLVTALNHNRSALTRPEDERRFNVAVSRAIEQVWLFHSITLADLSNINDLRYKILDHFINYKPIVPPIREIIKRIPGNQPAPFDSWFEVDVFNEIIQRGYNVIPQYEVARGKYRIDLVVIFSDGTKIAIECDGDKWHGAEQFQNDLLRQKVLERCGWQFFRIRGGEFYSNRNKTLSPLWELFEQKKESVLNQNINIPVFAENEEPELTKNENLLENLLNVEYVNNISTSDNDVLFSFQEFLVFTDKFIVYKVLNKRYETVNEILNSIDKEEADEKFIYITGSNDFKGFMLFGFENGKIAKVFLESYKTLTNRKKLKNAYSDLSKLVYIAKIEYDIDIAVISSKFKIIVFNTEQINPKESKSTLGNQVIKVNSSNNMIEVKRIENVTFKDIEYYRKNIPASGNYLLPHDEF